MIVLCGRSKNAGRVASPFSGGCFHDHYLLSPTTQASRPMPSPPLHVHGAPRLRSYSLLTVTRFYSPDTTKTVWRPTHRKWKNPKSVGSRSPQNPLSKADGYPPTENGKKQNRWVPKMQTILVTKQMNIRGLDVPP